MSASELADLIKGFGSAGGDGDTNLEKTLTGDVKVCSRNTKGDTESLKSKKGRHSNQDELVELGQALQMIARHQDQTLDESHMISKRKLSKGSTRLIFSALQNCKTIEDGLFCLAENYNILHGGQFNQVIKDDKTISYCVDDRNFHYKEKAVPLAIELALLGIHCTLSYLCRRPLNVVRFQSKRVTPPKYDHHLDIFQTELGVDHGQYELSYDISQAKLDIQHPSFEDILDVQEHHYQYFLELMQQSKKSNFLECCKTKILNASANFSLVEQDHIAEDFGMSVATLRRRLREHGSSFREIRDDCNNKLASEYLVKGHDIKKVSELLGYSDERSFSRAFKRWHGVSPSTFMKDGYPVLECRLP
ncbi:AraC family transcriptional regulator [Pseudoteredinibacter isoporae]|uniref:AraC family transcriptional regulator n=1 Tax=Pseudoteredinibacter isoporae TaxID=570281 RepID=UPI0033416CE4